MKIKILKDTVCDGERVLKDQIKDATPKSARFLINIGKAQEYIEPPKPKKKPVLKLKKEKNIND